MLCATLFAVPNSCAGTNEPPAITYSNDYTYAYSNAYVEDNSIGWVGGENFTLQWGHSASYHGSYKGKITEIETVHKYSNDVCISSTPKNPITVNSNSNFCTWVYSINLSEKERKNTTLGGYTTIFSSMGYQTNSFISLCVTRNLTFYFKNTSQTATENNSSSRAFTIK